MAIVGGAYKALTCTDGVKTMDRILDHLCQKEQELPTLRLLVRRTLTTPGALPLCREGSCGNGAHYYIEIKPKDRRKTGMVDVS